MVFVSVLFSSVLRRLRTILVPFFICIFIVCLYALGSQNNVSCVCLIFWMLSSISLMFTVWFIIVIPQGNITRKDDTCHLIEATIFLVDKYTFSVVARHLLILIMEWLSFNMLTIRSYAVAEVEPKFRCGEMNYYYAKLTNLYATTPT
jgi:hypothetical protein